MIFQGLNSQQEKHSETVFTMHFLKYQQLSLSLNYWYQTEVLPCSCFLKSTKKTQNNKTWRKELQERTDLKKIQET